VWQKLYDGLKEQNFQVITVAMDARPDAARPYIEAAEVSYPALIDRDHHVAALYNMVNVPQAVWIDEAGMIVRPPETAGAYEAFRALDFSTGKVPQEAQDASAKTRQIYLEAIGDWVAKGAASAHALSPDQVRSKLNPPDSAIAQAHAHFQLGQFLLRQGQTAAADKLFQEARQLHPKSWNIWRQTAEVGDNDLAAGPEFWDRVNALGEDRYYALVDMEGMPKELPQ
jgi:tetratricopeptide (TPR) repeat protein